MGQIWTTSKDIISRNRLTLKWIVFEPKIKKIITSIFLYIMKCVLYKEYETKKTANKKITGQNKKHIKTFL